MREATITTKYLRHSLYLSMLSSLACTSLLGQTTGGGIPSSPPVLSTDQNYVAAWTASVPEKTAGTLVNKQLRDVNTYVQYFDGLGRLKQSVAKQGSLQTLNSVCADIVSNVEYDNLGREAIQYLPFPGNGSSGSYNAGSKVNQVIFYSTDNPYNPIAGQGEKGVNASSLTVYENSPLNRISMLLPPGNSWRGGNIGTKQEYGTNTAADAVRDWDVSIVSQTGSGFGSYSPTGTFSPGRLRKTVVTDENGHQTIEFRDNEGLMVLRKVQNTASQDNGGGTGHDGWLCTYYLYDAINQLRCVIQPKGVSALARNGWNLSDPEVLTEQCFRYEYDHRGRMIMKKVPGSEPVYNVYDIRDRLVMTQDGNLRKQGIWIVTEYDDQNRPTITYRTPLGSSLPTILQDASTTTLPYTPGSKTDILSVIHYDDYDGLPSGLPTGMVHAWDNLLSAGGSWPYPVMPTVITPSSQVSTKGLPTWTQTRVLDGDATMLGSANYYDEKGQVVQTQSQNIVGGIDVVTTQYAWSGHPITVVTRTEKATGLPEETILVDQYTYDDLWRPIKTERKVSSSRVNNGVFSDLTILSESGYDAVGQIKQKTVGRQKDPLSHTYTQTPIEIQDYDYNIRGWLLGVNRDYVREKVSTDDTPPPLPEGFSEPSSTRFDDDSRLWGFDLGYDKVDNNLINGIKYMKNQLTGNITGMVWKTGTGGKVRKYDFNYDNVHRLKSAGYGLYLGGEFRNDAGDFSVSNLEYDENGNILSMVQKGVKPDGSSATIDDLIYRYKPGSNKLLNVDDSQNDPNSTLGDFHFPAGTPPKTTTTEDYVYDDNGSMTTDRNKNISSILYNHLNLPYKIVVDHKGAISYTFDAAGRKLKKETEETSGKKTVTLYLGAITYVDDQLQFIAHGEGRTRISGNGSFIQDFFLKDHLGNTRVVATDQEGLTNPILEETHYYPFGLTMKGISSTQSNPMLANKDKTFQGQRFDDDLGLNWVEFKYRNHDPQIGRFIEIDPLSDSFRYNSTYAFSENKVTGHIELEGLEAISLVDKNKEHNKGIAEAAANNRDKSAIHFYAHGAYNIIYNDNGRTTSEQRITTGRGLNSMLNKESSDWKNSTDHSGMTVVCHSCRTGLETIDKNGNKVESIAQIISGSKEFKDVTIIAPTERDYFSADGKEIGPRVSKFTDKNADYKEGISREKQGQMTSEQGNWNVFKNGKLIGSYDGSWTPQGNPGFWSNLFHKN